MTIATKIGQRIRFYRKKNNLTQEQLAELCNFHPTYIGQLERGEKNATLESIYKVAQSLNITLSQLFENIDSSSSTQEQLLSQIYQALFYLPPEKLQVFYDLLSLLQ